MFVFCFFLCSVYHQNPRTRPSAVEGRKSVSSRSREAQDRREQRAASNELLEACDWSEHQIIHGNGRSPAFFIFSFFFSSGVVVVVVGGLARDS